MPTNVDEIDAAVQVAVSRRTEMTALFNTPHRSTRQTFTVPDDRRQLLHRMKLLLVGWICPKQKSANINTMSG